MNKSIIFVLFLMFGFNISCGDVTVEPDIKNINDYGAVFILYSWTSNQHLGIFTKTDEPFAENNDAAQIENFVDSANITINEYNYKNIPKDSIIIFTRNHNINNLINYYSTDFNPIPNILYQLKITLKGKNILQGKTILPPKVEFTNITNDEKYFYIHWDKIDSLKTTWSLRDSTMVIITSESSFVNFAKINKKYVKHDKEYELRVYTFDKNLTEYKSKKIPRSGIDKHYGVFGSITRTIRKVKF